MSGIFVSIRGTYMNFWSYLH